MKLPYYVVALTDDETNELILSEDDEPKVVRFQTVEAATRFKEELQIKYPHSIYIVCIVQKCYW